MFLRAWGLGGRAGCMRGGGFEVFALADDGEKKEKHERVEKADQPTDEHRLSRNLSQCFELGATSTSERLFRPHRRFKSPLLHLAQPLAKEKHRSLGSCLTYLNSSHAKEGGFPNDCPGFLTVT